MGILSSIFHTNSYVMLGLSVGLATEPLTGQDRAGEVHGRVGMQGAGNNNQMVANGNMTADYCIKSGIRHTRDNFVIFFQSSSTKKVKCNYFHQVRQVF